MRVWVHEYRGQFEVVALTRAEVLHVVASYASAESADRLVRALAGCRSLRAARRMVVKLHRSI